MIGGRYHTHMSQFIKATKQQAKLRAALYGPSGAGKTYSMLRILRGMSQQSGAKIAVIDSERGSASKYADRFEFDSCELNGRSIDDYIEAIESAARAGYGLLGIDSVSHAWQELLEQVEGATQGKFRGNKWAAWSEGTPKYKRLIDAILSYPGHIVVTMRSKTAWEVTEDNGRKAYQRIGLSPEMRQGAEYEWDMLIQINTNHSAFVEKDRTGKFQDKEYKVLDESFGGELATWLNVGGTALDTIKERCTVAGITENQVLEFLKSKKKVEGNINQLSSVDEPTLQKLLTNWAKAVELIKQ